MNAMSRRGFLAGCTTVAAGLAARELPAASPPTEAGLSSEGLLAGHPGFQQRSVMPLGHAELPGFLSREQLAAHHAEYVHDVERLKDAEQQLRDASLDAARYGALRRAQTAAANGVLLHELYFGTLAPAKVEMPRYVARHLEEHMGGLERWVADFRRCALDAKAWALLVYDPYDDRWHNAILDGDDVGIWLGANPLVVCDVAEHAFGSDYRSREEYVGKFIDRIDWNEVATRYRAVDRM